MASRSKLPHGWAYHLFDGQLELIVDQINGNSRGLYAWIELRDNRTNQDTPSMFGTLNLLGQRTVSSIVSSFNDVTAETDQLPALEEVIRTCVYDTITEWREGPDPIDLASVTSNPERWLLWPFIGSVSHTRLIAAGGSGKSYLALAIGLTVALNTSKILGGQGPQKKGPVLYLDWEADAQTHRERMDAILRGSGLSVKPEGLIHYMPMRQPLYRQIVSIANKAAAIQPALVVVDSVMLARGSSSDGGSAEDSTLRLFEALAELDAPALLVDHKPKAVLESKSGKGGYGSVVMSNSVRIEWDMHKVFHFNDAVRFQMAMTKQNNTGRLPAQVYQIDFANNQTGHLEVGFKILPSMVPNISDDDNVSDRAVEVAQMHGPLTAEEIGEAIDYDGKIDSLKRMLRRAVERDELTQTDTVPRRYMHPDGPGAQNVIPMQGDSE